MTKFNRLQSGNIQPLSHFPLYLKLSATGVIGAMLLSFNSAAIQLQDGTTYFNRPPILASAEATHRSVNVPRAVYSFTLEMPNNAGEPLEKLVFEQVGGAETFRFDLNRVGASLGRSRRGDRQPTSVQPSPNGLTLVFDPPIPPGQTIVVALPVRRNPSAMGTYFIGVTAFPQGEKAVGQFIGFGRFRIQESSGDNGNGGENP
jgi:hypothetical protein